MKTKEIASSTAFPVPAPYICEGMSYRMWLIGQVANGLVSQPQYAAPAPPPGFGRQCVDLADAIIAQLEKEAAFPR